MDPFSLSLGALSAIGACSTSLKILVGFCRLGGAPALLQALNNEVADLRLALEDVYDHLEKLRDDEAIVRMGTLLLDQTKAKVQELEMLIQYRILKAGREASLEVQRLSFLQERNRLNRLQTDLRQARQRITALFGHVIARKTSNMEVLLRDVILFNSRAHNDTQASLARIEEMIRRKTQLDSSSPIPALRKLQGPYFLAGSSDETVEMPLTLVKHQPTGFRCVCRHQTQRLLHIWLGRLWLGYTIAPTLRCDRHAHLQNASTTLELSYFFPLLFLQSVIIFSLKISRASSLTVSLRLTELIPDDHPIFLSIKLGDTEGIRKLVCSGQVSIHAQCSNDESLLSVLPLLSVSVQHFNRACQQAIIMRKTNSIETLLHLGANSGGTSTGHIPSARSTAWRLILTNVLGPDLRDKLRLWFPEPDFDELYEFTPVHKAALGFHGYDLESSIHTTDINQTDCGGRAPLHWALVRGVEATVKTLLDHGADCESETHFNKMPLSLSPTKRCTELLLEAGANPRVKTAHSMTALHVQAWLIPEPQHLGCIEALVAAGADINAQDASGRTSLDFAIEEGNEAIAKYLIEHGADLTIYDIRGNNALCWAVRCNRHSTVKLLLCNGQDHLPHLEMNTTFVHLVVESADVKTLRILAGGNLKRRDINVKNKAGLTPAQVGLHRENVDVEWKAAALMEFLRSIDQDSPGSRGPGRSANLEEVRTCRAELDDLHLEVFEDALERQY